jgi:hypothetical protein
VEGTRLKSSPPEGTRLKELAGLPPALSRMFIKKRGGVGQKCFY